MTIQERAEKLIGEKQQLIARINQIDGALIEFEAIVKEEQEETVEDTDTEPS